MSDYIEIEATTTEPGDNAVLTRDGVEIWRGHMEPEPGTFVWPFPFGVGGEINLLTERGDYHLTIREPTVSDKDMEVRITVGDHHVTVHPYARERGVA